MNKPAKGKIRDRVVSVNALPPATGKILSSSLVAAPKNSQVKNASTGHWIKSDAVTGKFVATKSTKPFRGVRAITKFKSASNPSISPETARLAEKAVLALLNKDVK